MINNKPNMNIEDRVLNFFTKQLGSKSSKMTEEMDIAHVWGPFYNATRTLNQSDSLIENLHKFGNSEITNGVNIRDYIGIPAEQIKIHLDWQEQRFKELTSGIPTLESLVVPKSFNIMGKNVDEDSVIPITAYRLGYYVHNMLNALDVTKRNVVLEIGGGFGLTSLIFKRNMKNSCYIIIDIETTSVLSAYFLMSMGLKVCLYGEFDELNEKLTNEYDVIILPPHCIEKFPENSIDLAINTASFVEMSYKYVHYYLTHINKIAKKLYYDNHSISHFPRDYPTTDPSNLAKRGGLEGLCSRILKNFKSVIKRETPINFLQPHQANCRIFKKCLAFHERLLEKNNDNRGG